MFVPVLCLGRGSVALQVAKWLPEWFLGHAFHTSALSLALIVQNCELTLLAFLEVNAPNVFSNLRVPEDTAT